jgi:DNA (cytosine-5)-methyltransferase 1
MKVGTDFSGIGSPEMALKYLGIDFESVFACEIDKYARQSFKQLHNPKTFYNDITTRNHKDIEQLDLYVAGFPCQSFSMAGKRKGFDEARGTLFFNVAEFIQINQPKVFVLENVKGLLSHDKGRTFQTIIDILSNGGGTINSQISFDIFDDGLGYNIYWQVLNTKDFGIPQNRERIFIIGFKDYREFSFPKPLELKLKLGDILQDNPKSKYYLSDKLIESFSKHKERHTKKGTGFKWEVKKKDDIANCLRANASLCPTDNTIEVENKYYLSDKAKEKIKRHNNKSLKNDISHCIHAGYHSMGGRDQQYIKIDEIRRLTPLECWRLQGFRDEDFFSVKDVSDTQLYKQAGNSITVNVLMELFKKIYANDNK